MFHVKSSKQETLTIFSERELTKFSAMFLRHRVPWLSVDIQVKFYRDRPRGTHPSGELNRRGVAKYSDFGPIERYISETVQDRS